MGNSKVRSYIFLGTIFVVIAIVAIFNLMNNGELFWQATFYQIMSLLAVVFITYFLTQRLNDKRRKIDTVDHLLNEIQMMVNRQELHGYIESQDKSMALMYQRLLANKVECLKRYGKLGADIQNDVNYISNQCEEMKEFYGTHMEDKEYMKKSLMEFQKYTLNISERCDNIRIKLFC